MISKKWKKTFKSKFHFLIKIIKQFSGVKGRLSVLFLYGQLWVAKETWFLIALKRILDEPMFFSNISPSIKNVFSLHSSLQCTHVCVYTHKDKDILYCTRIHMYTDTMHCIEPEFPKHTHGYYVSYCSVYYTHVYRHNALYRTWIP